MYRIWIPTPDSKQYTANNTKIQLIKKNVTEIQKEPNDHKSALWLNNISLFGQNSSILVLKELLEGAYVF